MTGRCGVLRGLALAAVTAAIADPGCQRPMRARIGVATVGDLSPALRQQVIRQIAGAAPWADVVDESSEYDAARDSADGTEVSARVVAGDPAPVIAALQSRPAALALRAEGAALAIGSISVPARVVTGMRADVAVAIAGVPASEGSLRAVLRDASSAIEQGQVMVPAQGATNGERLVLVPWIATRAGQVRLRVEASFEPGNPRGDGAPTGQAPPVRPTPPADAVVDVQPAEAGVEVLEARPTWSGRFARLALNGVAGLRLSSEVRVSPGVAVRTGPGARTLSGSGSEVPDEAEVVLVGGLESLTAGDVSRLERAVTERGRALVLLMDEPAGPGPWQRLWPDPIGPLRESALPVSGGVAGHSWMMRAWTTPVVSTGTTPLAYLDSGSAPFVVGRARGAGRIVLVTALDAWRWRAAAGASFADGWRALVQRLAADVPRPVTTTAWVTGHGRRRSVHVDVGVRPDLRDRTGLAVTAGLAGSPALPVPLMAMESGRWRGARRVGAADAVRLVVEARAGGTVVGRTSVVVDVSPRAPAATWQDVQRHQSERGALAAEPSTVSAALERVRATWGAGPTRRWHVTRTWWFAGVVLSLLGAEWMLRRLHGAR